MLFAHEIKQAVVVAMLNIYNKNVDVSNLTLQPTKREFEGDITLVVFNLSKLAGKPPEAVADEIGEYLKSHCAEVERYNVIKGFLNIVVPDKAWLSVFSECCSDKNFGISPPDAGYVHSPVLVEYSSPNTNKPLHLGHIRNNLLVSI